jgi:hypothetical protein
MSIVLQSSSGGSVTINEPTTASNFTQTLPAATGTVMVSGNMPAFAATKSSEQSVSASTITKVTFDGETFDTNNNFASSTFTPTVAGYYLITGSISIYGTSQINCRVAIYKNGSQFLASEYALSNGNPTVAAVIYFNGTTDNVELYGRSGGGSGNIFGAQSYTYFTGCLMRAA